MKTITAFLFCLTAFALSTTLSAQPLSDRSVDGYISALNSGNTGAAESAMMIVSKLKIENPDMNVTKFEAAVKNMIASNRKMRNKYKLFLTAYILENPHSLQNTDLTSCENCNQFFLKAATKINQELASL